MKKLNMFEQHQFNIAKSTLRLTDAGAHILGGMTKVEARNFLRKCGWSEKRIATWGDYPTMTTNLPVKMAANYDKIKCLLQ
jgi:hypothetical protein